MLVVEPNPNRRPADPTQKRRSVSIGQIDHRIEPTTAEAGDEPPLRLKRSFIEDHYLVHVRIS
jgi:hypothetical protein